MLWRVGLRGGNAMSRQSRVVGLRAGLLLMSGVLCVLMAAAPPAWAAVTVVAPTASPSHIRLGERTDVAVSVMITDAATTHSLTAVLYRVDADGSQTKLTQLKDDGSKSDAVAGDGFFTGVQSFLVPHTATTITLKVVAAYRLASNKAVLHEAESAPFTIQAGGLVLSGGGGTIKGDGGVTVTVPPSALPYDAFVTIGTIDPSVITAPLGGNLGLVGAFRLIIEIPGFNGELQEPTVPLDVSFPAPPGTPEGGRYIIAKQIVFESVALSGSDVVIGAPTVQLMPVAVGTVMAGSIVTQPSALGGITSLAGQYAVLHAPGSGFVTGAVTEAGVAQAGVVVSNSSNALVDLTDASGGYSLFVSAGPSAPGGGGFSVIAFHPFNGSAASGSGTIASDGATVTVNLALVSLSPAANSRPGVRNGGFEEGTATTSPGPRNWNFTGAVELIQQLGPTGPIVANDASGNHCAPGTLGAVCTPPHPGDIVILPSEGKWMAVIDTGGQPGAIASSLQQVFTVPAGATTLRIDYNYVSEELPEWVGSEFQDPFRVLITPAGGTQTTEEEVMVDTAPFTVIGNCGFEGGDDTCGATGWRTALVDLSAYAGQAVTIELLFTVTDLGDDIFDTRVLVDNIRFSTIWLDVKVIAGASAQNLGSVAARVERDVVQMNKVLSQAGLNARIRGIQTITNADLQQITVQAPHTLGSPPNCTANGNVLLGADGVALTNRLMTDEENLLMRTGRGADADDVNVYYTVSTSVAARGWSANVGDFCQDVKTAAAEANWGSLITDAGTTRTLTHELGHILIRAITDSTLVHACSNAAGTCFTEANAPDTAIVTPTQSQAVNNDALTILKD